MVREVDRLMYEDKAIMKQKMKEEGITLHMRDD